MPVSFRNSMQSIPIKWSTSHMTNNLAIQRASASRRSITIGCSHKTGFAMSSFADDITKQIPGQVIARTSAEDRNPGAENDARLVSHIIQVAAFVQLPARNIFVLACSKSIQIYESNGAILLHFHPLDKNLRNRSEASVYARGIAGVGANSLCVGNHLGEILVFSIPQDGNNLFLTETMPGHPFGITSLVSNTTHLISSDTHGGIILWNTKTMLQTNTIKPVDDSGITSLALWNNCLAASYANGMIRIFDIHESEICGSIAAHARAINAIDFNDEGLLVSVGDDSYIRMWRLIGDADNLQIIHQLNHQLENLQLVGVKFLNLSDSDIAVSAYDSLELMIFRS